MNALVLMLLVRLAANPTAFAHQLRGRVTTTTLATTGPNFKDEVGFRALASIAMAKATTGGGAANAARTASDDAVILNKDEAPFVVVASDSTTPPSATPAPAPAPTIATLAPTITGTPTTFPPTPEPTRPPSHSSERVQIATEAPSVLTKEGTMSVPTIASDAISSTFAPSASILEAAVDDEEVTNTTNTATTNGSTVSSTFTPTCVSSISYWYKEAELVTHCSKNSDCAGWTQDGPGCCLHPHCICGPMEVGSASVSCLAY